MTYARMPLCSIINCLLSLFPPASVTKASSCLQPDGARLHLLYPAPWVLPVIVMFDGDLLDNCRAYGVKSGGGWMGVQSWLDTCSKGRFDNGSEWHLQHASECGRFRKRCPQQKVHTTSLWLHVAGDSTMRFFYAGLLSRFNGTAERSRGYPLHWLPSNDSCAFAKVGWPSTPSNRCYDRWRGRCHPGSKNGCWLDAR